MRRIFDRGEPLHSAWVRKPKRSHISVRPWLLGGPFNRVVSVVSFALVRIEFTVGGVAAAHILNDHRIAPRDRFWKSGPGLWCVVLPVWRAINEYRKSSLSLRQQNVRTKD